MIAALFPYLLIAAARLEAAVQPFSRAVLVDGHSYAVSGVRVQLNRVKIRLGLAQGKVGLTEDLAAIAKRYHAAAAINGSFFQAYVDNPVKNPNHTLITGSEVVHVGNVGTMIGFGPKDTARIQRVEWTVRGSRDGSSAWPHNWFAYWINRYPEGKTVTIFSHYYYSAQTPAGGTAVVVQSGEVKAIVPSPVEIPSDGFVIYFKDAEPSLMGTFKVGQKCTYAVDQKGVQDAFWNAAEEGLGAGPLLVSQGRVNYNPEAEGFSSVKILSSSGARSAVGLTSSGELIMIVTNGTVRQLAGIMQSLGCDSAMNLDGGASSGLWVNNRSLRTPGRQISNALLVIDR